MSAGAWDRRAARRQARMRARAQGLTVFKVREHRELQWSYFAAETRDQAIVMLVRSYRPWPRPWSRA